MATTAEIGAAGERIAESFYRSNGYQLLARNFRLTSGEIDLILQKDNEILFVEVKGRKVFNPDEAWSARWREKKRKLRRAAAVFLARNPDLQHDASEIRLEIVYVTHGRVSQRFEAELFF